MQKIVVTHGECGGVNYELFIRTFLDSALLDIVHPTFFGSSKILNMVAKSMGNNNFLQKARHLRIEEVLPVSENVQYSRGTATKVSGEMACVALEKAVKYLKTSNSGILLTFPIDIEAVRLSRPEFKNQASLIASSFSAKMPYRMFLSDSLKTTFMMSSGSQSVLTSERIKNRIVALHNTFKRDFSILSPRIAVLSMNENIYDTKLCEKDNQVLTPVINELMVNGHAVFGPFTTTKALEICGDFDVMLCIYREQQQLFFKDRDTSSLCFFTAGLPIVHVEPHLPLNMGQLTDIPLAEQDLRNAIYWGVDIFSHREENVSVFANPLCFN
ncbi:MAG: 4-hydroxythreonine-4-phosphate dehydrogenase PdxA [Bacteroidales bacterium]|jgi:4-hydroxythreonine-4-phosphate dehydrogenase|nr:4-hydroxythreonine-4-phosphate dehydrogenase PdxA [Bacteroidales bacterium]